jgi:hypothetical protein
MGAQYPVSDLGETRIAGLTLSPGRNAVEIEFFSPGGSPTSHPRYQYKLDSADDEWSPPTSERGVNFASLAPGSYRFLVRAVSPSGVPSSQPATVEFTVMKPLWARWWFLTTTALALAILAYAIYRYRVAQLLRVEGVRARIAADLHDDIGASLSQIVVLSEAARARLNEARPDAGGPLAEISTICRDAMDSMSDMVWAINPRYDRLSNLVARVRRFSGDILGPRDIALAFRAPDRGEDPMLGAEVRRNLLLIAKEAVHNIAKHSGATEARIDFELLSHRLTLTVSDNGRGFDCTEARQGNGLVNISRRAAWLGGSAELDVSPGKGAVITVSAPL